jgi:hypothetical protein
VTFDGGLVFLSLLQHPLKSTWHIFCNNLHQVKATQFFFRFYFTSTQLHFVYKTRFCVLIHDILVKFCFYTSSWRINYVNEGFVAIVLLAYKEGKPLVMTHLMVPKSVTPLVLFLGISRNLSSYLISGKNVGLNEHNQYLGFLSLALNFGI